MKRTEKGKQTTGQDAEEVRFKSIAFRKYNNTLFFKTAKRTLYLITKDRRLSY